MRFIGVDWSGAQAAPAQRKAIWTASVEDGQLTQLSSGRSRAEAVAHVLELADDSDRTVVGLDFAFSLPEWWLAERGFDSAESLWAWSTQSAADAEAWIKDLPPPFWGTNFRLRPTDCFNNSRGEFRHTEIESTSVGARPMSGFRLFGPGTVGAQGLRGHPHLLTLQEKGFAVWPFDEAGLRLVVEVFPRLLVRQLCPGMARLSGPALQQAVVNAAPEGFRGESDRFADKLRSNQDALDAAISAYALWLGRDQLTAGTLPASDGAYSREGRIWSLPREVEPFTHAAHDAGDPFLAAFDSACQAMRCRGVTVGPRPDGTFFAFRVPAESNTGHAVFGSGASLAEAVDRAMNAEPN